MVSEERKTKKRGFIQYLYEERLKDEEIQARAKDMVTWSAEPGNAKASISVDRRRYETVCVPRSNPCCCLPFILLSSALARVAMESPSCRISTTQQLPMSYSRPI